LKDGNAATGIKIVAYAPACKIQRIDLALPKTSTVGEEFVCHGLPNVTLAGQIKPVEMLHVENGQLAGFGNLGGVGSGCLALRHQFLGTDGPFRKNEGRRRMSRMSAFLLPSFNMFYILACGAMAWFAVRRHLLR